MNYFVPDFVDELADVTGSGGDGAGGHQRRYPSKHQSLHGEELFEILWQKGPVSQPVQANGKHSASAPIPLEPPDSGGGGEGTSAAAGLFMEDNEMMEWFQYQIDGEEGSKRDALYGDLLDSSAVTTAAERESTADGSNEAVHAEPVRTSEADRASSDERRHETRKCSDALSEDPEFASADEKKSARRSASARRKRVAETHNLSERRRRDRINEKMRTLQELIPRCNKSDKASMLDEAIEYLKTLQQQVQMMSMGCNMAPMMYPGMQAYLPAVGMTMNMDVGMVTGMGTRMPMVDEMGARGFCNPLIPFGNLLPGTQMRPGSFPKGARPFIPSFHPPGLIIADRFGAQASNQPLAATNLVNLSSTIQFQNAANFPHSYPCTDIPLMFPQSRAMPESKASRATESTTKTR